MSFHGLPHSAALEDVIRERIAWLERFYPGIVRCRVVVELPHRHRHDGRHVDVRIELTVPGGAPIVVSHEPSLHGHLRDVHDDAHHKAADLDAGHEYAAVAVRRAFDAARRALEDFAREQRGDVKTHQGPANGVVAELSIADGYGIIQAGESRVYFHRASVLDDAFETLAIGTPVAFVEERGDKGPQASTVRVLGRHHYAGS